MQTPVTVTLLSVLLGLSAGCANLSSRMPWSFGSSAATTASAPQAALAMTPANPAGLESCEVLGLVTANAECACYDRMSYEQVRGQASSNVLEAARSKYPDTDVVRVSSVDLYLNNAVAHGVAYRCAPARRS